MTREKNFLFSTHFDDDECENNCHGLGVELRLVVMSTYIHARIHKHFLDEIIELKARKIRRKFLSHSSHTSNPH